LRLAKFSQPTSPTQPSDTVTSPKKEVPPAQELTNRTTKTTETPPRPTPKIISNEIRPVTPPKPITESKEQKIHRLLSQIFKATLNIKVTPKPFILIHIL
jgi:hypothetical protein